MTISPRRTLSAVAMIRRDSIVRLGMALACAMLLLPNSIRAQQPTSDPSLRHALESARRAAMDAWQKQDAETLKATMAPDFIFVSPGGVMPRTQWLQMLTQCSMTSYSIEQVQANPISTDAAVMVFKLKYAGACNGTPNSSESFVTDTFARRDGKWWIVATAYMPH